MLHIKGYNRLVAEPAPNGPFESTVLARPLPVTKPYRAHLRLSPSFNWLCRCANLTIPEWGMCLRQQRGGPDSA